MTIEYRVDPDRRIVLTRVDGWLTHEEMLAYQREAWSHPELDGYDELIDMTDAGEMVQPSPERIREVARLAAGMDPPASSSRLVVVAPTDLTFGLARMLEAYRDLDARSTKRVAVFRTMEEAQAYLARPASEPEPDGGPLGR
jgi:hypothetical protein